MFQFSSYSRSPFFHNRIFQFLLHSASFSYTTIPSYFIHYSNCCSKLSRGSIEMRHSMVSNSIESWVHPSSTRPFEWNDKRPRPRLSHRKIMNIASQRWQRKNFYRFIEEILIHYIQVESRVDCTCIFCTLQFIFNSIWGGWKCKKRRIITTHVFRLFVLLNSLALQKKIEVDLSKEKNLLFSGSFLCFNHA